VGGAEKSGCGDGCLFTEGGVLLALLSRAGVSVVLFSLTLPLRLTFPLKFDGW